MQDNGQQCFAHCSSFSLFDPRDCWRRGIGLPKPCSTLRGHVSLRFFHSHNRKTPRMCMSPLNRQRSEERPCSRKALRLPRSFSQKKGGTVGGGGWWQDSHSESPGCSLQAHLHTRAALAGAGAQLPQSTPKGGRAECPASRPLQRGVVSSPTRAGGRTSRNGCLQVSDPGQAGAVS